MNDERDDHPRGRHTRHSEGRGTPPLPPSPGLPPGRPGAPRDTGGPAWPGAGEPSQPGFQWPSGPGAGGDPEATEQQPVVPPGPGGPGPGPQWPENEAPQEQTGAWTPSFDDDDDDPQPPSARPTGSGAHGMDAPGSGSRAGRPGRPRDEQPTQNIPAATDGADDARGAGAGAVAAGAGAAAGAMGGAAAGAVPPAGNVREPGLLTHAEQNSYNYYADDDADPFGDDLYSGQDDPDRNERDGDDFGAGGGPADDADLDDEMSPEQARRATIWRRVRRGCYIAAAAAVVIPMLVFIYGYIAWEPPDQNKLLNMKQPVEIQYNDGSVLGRISPEGSREVVRSLDEIGKPMQQAIVSAEDSSFYENPGFDFMGIVRSVFFLATGSGVGGGSTITQQYIKLDLELNQTDATYVRKIKEIVLSFKITNTRTKDDILLSYLNTAYYGRGANGITAASKAYFNKLPKDLTPEESAILAGVVQRPTQNDPREDEEQASTRWHYVIGQMEKNGFIPPGSAASMQMPTTEESDQWKIDRSMSQDQYKIRSQVLRELAAEGIDEDTLTRGGYKIKTTIDPKAQKSAVDAVNHVLDGEPQNIQPSLVAVEPKTGEVKAYFGGRTDAGGFDYAVAPQEPGSSFKPFVVLAGLHKGVGIGEYYDGSSPQTIEGTEFANSPGVACDVPTHCPVREAMTKSVNTVFVNMASKFGSSKVADAAHAAGIPETYQIGGKPAKTIQRNGVTEAGVALGMYPVKPIDMAASYATFANQGKFNSPHLVREIINRTGEAQKIHNDQPKNLYDESDAEAGKLAYNTLSAMTEVAEHSKLSLAGNRPVLSKTGTHQYLDTKDNQNAWMIGATPQLSTAVSMLADENGRNVPLKDHTGKIIYGSNLPGQVWQEFMNAYHKNLKVEKFPTAPEIGEYQDVPAPQPTTSSQPSATQPPTTSATVPERPGHDTTKPGRPGDSCGGLFQKQCPSDSPETSQPNNGAALYTDPRQTQY